jgi:hypothetical protein
MYVWQQLNYWLCGLLHHLAERMLPCHFNKKLLQLFVCCIFANLLCLKRRHAQFSWCSDGTPHCNFNVTGIQHAQVLVVLLIIKANEMHYFSTLFGKELKFFTNKFEK